MIRLSAAVAAWCLYCVSASAISLVPMTFDELVAGSVAVVYARVAEVRGQWTADRRGIDSVMTIDALEYFKGDLSDRVTVRTPGGRAGGMINLIPGAPVFAEGDLVVLFLKASGPSIPVPTGLTQGVFRVTLDPATRAPLVQPPSLHAAGAGRIVRGDPAHRPVALPVFATRVREAMKDAR